MSYQGKVRNGVVEFDQGPVPPEGTVVRVEPVAAGAHAPNKEKTLADAMLELAGTIEDLPPDFARNHDHYIHGQSKR